LPKVVTQRCLEQDLNLRPTGRKPKCLTVTPPRHRVRRSRGEMYIGYGHVCVSVCLYLAAFPQYCTDPNVTWGMVGAPSSCALLGGFAIGARGFRCYDNIAPNAKCQRVLVLALCLVITINVSRYNMIDLCCDYRFTSKTQLL